VATTRNSRYVKWKRRIFLPATEDMPYYNKKENYAMKTKNIALFFISLLLLTGCLGSLYKMSFVFNNYTFKDVLTDGYSEYRPDPGYKWLVINVTAKNNTKKDQSLNWFMDKFEFITANGNAFDMKLLYEGITGELPRAYPPQESRTGDIYFHVPEGTSVNASRITFKGYNESIRSAKLTNLPAK
jgi:hypothetical protein